MSPEVLSRTNQGHDARFITRDSDSWRVVTHASHHGVPTQPSAPAVSVPSPTARNRPGYDRIRPLLPPAPLSSSITAHETFLLSIQQQQQWVQPISSTPHQRPPLITCSNVLAVPINITHASHNPQITQNASVQHLSGPCPPLLRNRHR
jgi:hypothetical protein